MDLLEKMVDSAIKTITVLVILVIFSPLIFFLLNDPGERIETHKQREKYESDYKEMANEILDSYGFEDATLKIKCTFRTDKETGGYINNVVYTADVEGKFDYNKWENYCQNFLFHYLKRS